MWDRSDAVPEKAASSWMASLSDDLPLSEVHLPGTHDSTSYYINLPYFLRCQNTRIPDQLKAGFRYLDLRLRSDKDRIILCHGFGICRKSESPFSEKLTLEDVVGQIYEFLDGNPTETVVITAKAEKSEKEAPDIARAFQRLMEERPERWLESDTLPTLGDARGRIVLLRRYEDVLGLGDKSGIYTKWDEQMEEVPLEEALTGHTLEKLQLYVQDRFCYNIEGKVQLITAGRRQASSKDLEGALRINFCNTTGVRRISHPKSVSATVNSLVSEMDFSGNFGWVIFDYGTPELAKMIYSTN